MLAVYFYVVVSCCFIKEVKIYIPNLLVTFLTILQDCVKLLSRLSAPGKCSNKRPIEELEKGWGVEGGIDFIV